MAAPSGVAGWQSPDSGKVDLAACKPCKANLHARPAGISHHHWKKRTMLSRAEIAEMVGPDFDLLISHINRDQSHREIGDAWDAELGAILAKRATAAGIRDEEDFKRFAAIYLEEQKAMTDRRVQGAAFSQQIQNVAARTAVRATVWEVFFSVFRIFR
jgi:hypothetical protein